MTKSKETWQTQIAGDWPVPLRPTVEVVRADIDSDFLRLGVGSNYSEEKVKEHHGKKFDRAHGSDAKKAALRLKQIRDRIGARKTERVNLQNDLRATPIADKGSASEPPPPMPAPERFTVGFYAVLLVVIYGLSGTVVYANIAKTQPDLIASGALGFYAYFAIPLFFPVILDISASNFASIVAQQRFNKLVLCLALIGCVLFVLTWSLESYEAGRPLQVRFEDAFNKASGAPITEPSSTEYLRAVLAPYALFIQLVSEGLMLTALWAAIMKVWRTYTRRRPAKSDEILVMETTLSSLTAEIDALEEHEAAMVLAVEEFADRRADLINAALAMYATASNSLTHPEGSTVRQFRRH